jgi:iron complex transport system substrate-binding protein
MLFPSFRWNEDIPVEFFIFNIRSFPKISFKAYGHRDKTFSSLKVSSNTLSVALLSLCFLLPSPSLWANNVKHLSANRIVSTSPSITEILFELGLNNRVIAVTDFCNHPQEACKLPSIGGMTNPNMEKMVSLKPDLIIYQSGSQRIASNTKNLGIETLELDLKNIEGIFKSIRKLGTTLNCEEPAGLLLLRLKNGIAYYQKRQFPKKEVLLILGESNGSFRDLYAVGPETFLSELLSLSGGNNIIRISQAQYPKISKEYIIEQSPEIIIEASPNPNLPQKEIDLKIKEWNRFPTIKAVKNKQVYFIGADYLLIPGPRFLEIVELFSKVIHPDLFTDQIAPTNKKETRKQ